MSMPSPDVHLGTDLEVGYVLHLDPKRLPGLGAKVTGAATNWVVGHHFFVRIEADPKRCRMTPLFSNDGPGRIGLSRQGRHGHEKWTKGVFYCHPDQVWTASRQAISRAAADAGDLSRPSARNLLEGKYVPKIPERP